MNTISVDVCGQCFGILNEEGTCPYCVRTAKVKVDTEIKPSDEIDIGDESLSEPKPEKHRVKFDRTLCIVVGVFGVLLLMVTQCKLPLLTILGIASIICAIIGAVRGS